MENDGIGISTDMLPRVFEIFSQAASPTLASQGGLGMGLSVVKGLVELHGCAVEAKSEGPGRGSVLSVRLLVRAASVGEVQYIEVCPPDSLSHRRILVVDDNHHTADILTKLLSMPGNEVRTAYDGQQFLEIAEWLLPEVVLLDIGMPSIAASASSLGVGRPSWSP